MSLAQDKELLLDVLTVAEAAGDAIMEVYESDDFDVQIKGDDSPLTAADLASHQAIMQGLSLLTPDIPVLSEESDDIDWPTRQQWNTYWLIDPLDGTKEFIKRNGEFTVNIALIDQGKPVLGVVVAPVLGTAYIGGIELGAYKIESGKETAISALAPRPSDTWAVVGSRSHQSKEVAEFLTKLPSHEMVAMGSSLKICLVAEGRAHLYPRLGLTSEWDTAAAHAVLVAAGGEMVDADSREPLRYNHKESILNPFFIAASSALLSADAF
ncbi:3'(2'),5'-bisphosphate nucleotidase CysQ [Corallincola spongiicola]|uniref:3'(2'),5'-bisphosphate nucleotidase CysQ n=1 Tax=Corallincola spongiicola TaxID=2520508 RepID=A0ABY1WT13_9GAMM|nr:3'(2'),5'-bisphosphate nucleotidase CysQ [Corallincola spongiicola]TAA47716.1 3'(2'),5'-bisphosphate nucleotidase [Corallincola spongiicola]